MKNNTVLFIIILICTVGFAQEERTPISGNIKSEGADLENIHILNKNTWQGTITDANGIFTIETKAKDTLIITGIQFYYVEIPITTENVKNKTITIDLLQKMNELEEVEVKHNLTGNIYVDGDGVKIVKHVKDGALNFADIDYDLVKNVNNHTARIHSSNDSELMPNMNPNLIAIAGIILTPIVKGISKIGKTKRNIKKYDNRHQAKVMQAYENLRPEYGDAFFTETLKIPPNHIDQFITSCLPKGIGNLYADDKKIEIIDLFIAESKIYLKNINEER